MDSAALEIPKAYLNFKLNFNIEMAGGRLSDLIAKFGSFEIEPPFDAKSRIENESSIVDRGSEKCS